MRAGASEIDRVGVSIVGLAVCILALVYLPGCFRNAQVGDEDSNPPTEPTPADTPPPPDDTTPPDEPPTPAANDALPCITCHSVAMGSRAAVVNSDGSGGHVLAGTSLTNGDCALCHEMTEHQQGLVRLWSDPLNPSTALTLPADPTADSSAADQLVAFCERCHGGSSHPTIHTPGGAWRPACTECHAIHEPSNANLSLVASTIRNETLDMDKPVVFTARSGAGSFADGAGNDGVCQVCHTRTTYHRHNGTGTSHNEGAACTECHPHGNGFMPAPGLTSCVGCHSTRRGSRSAVVRSNGSGGHHLGGGVLTDADCQTCHATSLHQGGTVRLWTNPNNPSATFSVTGDPNALVPFCRTCHDALTHQTTHATGASWEPACTECHDLHDLTNANLSLVRDVVRNETLGLNKPVTFTARSGAGSFSDSDPAVDDGICQVCHTDTTYHLHDGSGVAHNDGTDCSACHAHQEGFAGAAGGGCQGCHATAQGGRRPIIGEFSFASHHLSGAALADSDCEVCHDMSQHQQGQVRLKNADDPTNAGLVVALMGDPATSLAESVKLEEFCLACHDANGAGGSAPFTNAVMPATIDETLWNNASHRTGASTCFGDGQTFGCHSSGHGSLKLSLLAPFEVAPTAPSKAEEQEGFCYACHDADGPAATDIESLFALTTHHNVSFSDQADGSKIECTDCHDPHTATAAAPLVNPDSGGVFSGDGSVFCLTCHDGTPPPGVVFPPVATGTGFDKSGFIGTSHELIFGPNSCRDCHDPHGSSHVAILRSLYVVDDYNDYAAGDYVGCWLCHTENQIIEQKNDFGELHKKHVKDESAPCIICHDVHQGYDAGEEGLIDFDYSIRSGYDIQYLGGSDASSVFSLNPAETEGSCLLTCHGEQHGPDTYER